MGDGEIEEGAVWEAAMAGSKFKTDHVIAILDNNGVQLDGTVEEIMPLGDIAAKWSSFGWNVIKCDGHNVSELQMQSKRQKHVKGSQALLLQRL